MSEEAPSKAPQDARGDSPEGTAGQNHHGGRGTEKRVLVRIYRPNSKVRAVRSHFRVGPGQRPPGTAASAALGTRPLKGGQRHRAQLGAAADSEQIRSRAALADSPMSTKEQRKAAPLHRPPLRGACASSRPPPPRQVARPSRDWKSRAQCSARSP